MKKVCLLTMDSLDRFECYDSLLIEPLSKLDWAVEEISWRKENVNWNDFDAVIVRSTWDYQDDVTKFFTVLEQIDKSSARLENSLSVMKWNMNKSYLRDLQNKGVKIVDTIWEKEFRPTLAEKYFEQLKAEEIIIKPNVSANADNTFRIKISEIDSHIEKFQKIFSSKEFMVQPFIKSIVDEGEYSLIFFGGKFSHALIKKPKENDFRVQEEHGGSLTSVSPSQEMIVQAETILDKINPLPLYGRIDFVRTSDNKFALMELELIEPSLYFNLDDSSAERFANIFNEWMKT